MITTNTEFVKTPKKVLKAAEKGNFKSLSHAAASIAKQAKSTIKRGRKGKASQVGRPPHTHRRAFFRRAIRFHVDKQKQDAVIGFRHSIIGEIGAVHEFGETYEQARFPERPTIGPALEVSAPRLGNEWRGSITS